MKLSAKIFLPIILISALLILLSGCFLAPSEEQPALTLYTVIYNRNGSDVTGTVPVDANLYKKGDLVTVLGNTGTPALVNTGYDFYGWNTAADGSGTSRPVGYVFAMGTSDVTLYAMWDLSPAYTPEEPPIGGGGGGYIPPAVPCVDKLEVYSDSDPMVLCYDSSGFFTLNAIYDDAIVESLLDNDDVDYIYDSGIVTVDNAGTITAVGCGETTIEISYTDPVCGGDPKTASIDVEVKEIVIVIDGILSSVEWDCATEIPVAGGMGTVLVLATVDYLYVAYDLVDSTDVRLGEGYGDDKIGLNINPTDGGPWGFPYDILFQTGINPDAWQGPSSGLTDDYETQWLIDGTQYDIPDDLKTKTIFNGTRISEWKVPLDSMALSPGDVIKVGGATDIEKISYKYPVGLLWDDASTYFDIVVY